MSRRLARALDRAASLSSAACAIAGALLFAAIALVLLRRGLPALDLEFLLGETTGAGASGGVRYQLLGTLILVTSALVLAAPPAVALALLQTVYLPASAARKLRVVLLSANGVPSILFGIVGLIVFARWLGWGKSWLAGGAVLAMMVLPTASVALIDRIEALPARYFEAAAGLGLTRSQTVCAVVLPQSATGLASGLLLGLARAAGETAPILFTAAVFSGATVPTAIRDSPVLALPYHIFVLAQDSLDPASRQRLWAAAFVLLMLVLAASLAALPARLKLHEEARDA
jgi:phosphate transport system permease protein